MIVERRDGGWKIVTFQNTMVTPERIPQMHAGAGRAPPHQRARQGGRAVSGAVMRVFSGVVLGYLLFELLWFALFRVTNTDPHAPASISFDSAWRSSDCCSRCSAGYLASFIGGRPHFVAAWVCRRRWLR